jgi:hypothetical protein
MRVGLIISVIVHAAILLWVTLAPGAKPFDPARADPILVELLSPKEVPPLAEPKPPNPDPPKSELPESDLPKPAPLKSAPLKPEPPKPVLEADPKPPPKPDPETTAAASADAARLAWMLNLPAGSLTGLGALPSESGSNLSSDEIAKFKARVSKCWVAPADVPSTPGFNVLIRVALNPAPSAPSRRWSGLPHRCPDHRWWKARNGRCGNVSPTISCRRTNTRTGGFSS